MLRVPSLSWPREYNIAAAGARFRRGTGGGDQVGGVDTPVFQRGGARNNIALRLAITPKNATLGRKPSF